MLHTASDSHEIRGLTGIRGFAAVLVLVFHAWVGWSILFPGLRLLDAPVSQGGVGVDIFFVLSGFILSYVYNAGGRELTLPEYGRFLWFRLARIYPNHLATLLLLGALVVLAHGSGVGLGGSYPLDDLPYQLSLTQSWPFAPENSGAVWNFPSWSISAEWFAYLAVFPLTVFCLRRIQGSVLALILGFGALVAWCAAATSQLFPGPAFPLAQVSFEFFAGGMFFRVFLLGGGWVGFFQRWLTALGVTFLGLLCCPDWIAGHFAILALCPLILLGLTAEVSFVARMLSTPAALWLGRVSYSLYMTHGIALKLIKVLLPSDRYAHDSLVTRVVVFLGNLAIIFTLTIVLYYLVEIPARNYLRRMSMPWTCGRKSLALQKGVKA